MPNYRHTPRLNQRVVEESQLLAEEKWIIEALKKIKAQRNALQIERLHLESMREKITAGLNKDQPKKSNEEPTGQSTSTDDEMTEASTSVAKTDMFKVDIVNKNHSRLDTDELCNMEELNLSVTNSIFNNDPYSPPCDEEEDEEDMENCLLDIDLLMSGK